MTDPDDRLRRLYGTLPREEPPPALDAAVLAAARRAVARPSLVRRWGAPASIAAVLVLAVGVTLEMRREQPGIETSVAPASPPAAAAPEASLPEKPAEPPKAQRAMKAKQAPRRAQSEPAPKPAPKPTPEAAPEMKREASPSADAFSAAPAAARLGAPGAPAAPSPQSATGSATSAPGANLSMQKRAVAEGPTAELERIAKLRDEGKDAEADRALDAFRRSHPGYRIEDAMWERVKPR